MRLAETKEGSSEATKLNQQIEGIVEDLKQQAMRLGKVEKVVKPIAPESRAEQQESLKALQSEQVEELGRTVARKKSRLTEKVRNKMVELIQNDLDAHNAKPAPNKEVNPKGYTRYVNRRIALESELAVAKNADLETLSSRANIREASDLRYTPPSKIKLEKELKQLKKDQAENDTPKIRARIAKIEGLLKYIQEAKTAETGIGAESYMEERKTEAEKAGKVRVYMRELPPEVTKAQEAAANEKKRLEGIQKAKNKRANDRILADAFEKAVKGLNYEEQGREVSNLTKDEYAKLVKTQMDVWSAEASDTGLNLGDFADVFKDRKSTRLNSSHT